MRAARISMPRFMRWRNIEAWVQAIRVQSGIPGLPSTYGVGRGKMYYEPAEKMRPSRMLGAPSSTWISFRGCSNAFERNLAMRFICCTTPTSPDADRSGPAWQKPGTLSLILAGGCGPGGVARKFSNYPAAYDNASGRWRSLQHHFRLPAIDRGAVD